MPAKKCDSFGDVEHYQAKKEIKERFNKILTDLQKTVERNGYAVQTVQRFRECLENPENNDISRLPFYSETPFSSKRNRIQCILCWISCTIQMYWNFCNGDDKPVELINRSLSELEHYIKKGLKAFRTVHKPEGYYLVEIK